MDATKCCPFCAEEILSAAIKCKHCGSNLTGGLPAPTAELGKKKSSAIVRYGGGFLLVCVALAHLRLV
jgi:ribosomal protein L37AE/L43A